MVHPSLVHICRELTHPPSESRRSPIKLGVVEPESTSAAGPAIMSTTSRSQHFSALTPQINDVEAYIAPSVGDYDAIAHTTLGRQHSKLTREVADEDSRKQPQFAKTTDRAHASTSAALVAAMTTPIRTARAMPEPSQLRSTTHQICHRFYRSIVPPGLQRPPPTLATLCEMLKLTRAAARGTLSAYIACLSYIDSEQLPLPIFGSCSPGMPSRIEGNILGATLRPHAQRHTPCRFSLLRGSAHRTVEQSLQPADRLDTFMSSANHLFDSRDAAVMSAAAAISKAASQPTASHECSEVVPNPEPTQKRRPHTAAKQNRAAQSQVATLQHAAIVLDCPANRHSSSPRTAAVGRVSNKRRCQPAPQEIESVQGPHCQAALLRSVVPRCTGSGLPPFLTPQPHSGIEHSKGKEPSNAEPAARSRSRNNSKAAQVCERASYADVEPSIAESLQDSQPTTGRLARDCASPSPTGCPHNPPGDSCLMQMCAMLKALRVAVLSGHTCMIAAMCRSAAVGLMQVSGELSPGEAYDSMHRHALLAVEINAGPQLSETGALQRALAPGLLVLDSLQALVANHVSYLQTFALEVPSTQVCAWVLLCTVGYCCCVVCRKHWKLQP